MSDAYMDLSRKVVGVLRQFWTATALEPNLAYLQLRIHPEDWMNVLKSRSVVYLISKPQEVEGVAVVVDASQTPGHPTLRSTWEMVL